MSGRAAAVEVSARVAALAGESERLRRLPDELVSSFRESGLFTMAMPKALGGDELDVQEIIDAIAIVSEADGSAGWCVMIAATSALFSAFIEPDVARSMFDRTTALAGAVAPNGVAERVGDDLRVNGRWAFMSGCEHADWIAGACVIDGGVRSVWMPRDAVEIVDTWDVSGLRGTGSNDVVANDVVVPASYSLSLAGEPFEPGPLYRFPVFGLLALGVAAVALGMGRRAIAEIVELGREKTPTAGRRKLSGRQTIQADLARAEALVASSTALVEKTVSAAWDASDITVEHRRMLRLAATNAARSCAQAVDLCYEAGGGTSIYSTSALQRCFRDIHALTQHMVVAPSTYELFGRLAFGLETDTSLL